MRTYKDRKPSINISVRFHQEELEFIDKKKKGKDRSEFIRERTLQDMKVKV
jgi:hypothetical protein